MKLKKKSWVTTIKRLERKYLPSGNSHRFYGLLFDIIQSLKTLPMNLNFEVAAVHISNSLCLMAGVGVGSDGLHHELNENAIKTLNLSAPEVEALFTMIPETIKKVKDLL